MTTTTTRPKPTRRDPLIAELMRDYGFKTERELRARLRTAMAWAREHGVIFGQGMDESTECVTANVGRMVSQYAGRMEIEFHTPFRDWESFGHRRLLMAATALFLFSHPATRRNVEAGRCKRMAE